MEKLEIKQVATQSKFRSDNKEFGVNAFRIKVPNAVGNGQLIQLFEGLQETTSDVRLFFRPVIDYFWGKFFKFQLIQMFLFYVNVLSLVVCIIYYQGNRRAQFVGNLANFVLLLVELKTALSQGRKYLSSIFNLFDVIVAAFSIFGYFFAEDALGDDELTVAIGVALAIVFLRAIFYLRVFSATRFLIAMIIRVFYDFVAFVVIFLNFIGLAVLIDQYFDVSETGEEATLNSYFKMLQNHYLLSLGEFAFDELTDKRLAMFFIYTVVLLVIMMNLLIAVISSTYEDFTENREDYDLQELIHLCLDYFYLFRTKGNNYQWDETFSALGANRFSKQYNVEMKYFGSCTYKMAEERQEEDPKKVIK